MVKGFKISKRTFNVGVIVVVAIVAYVIFSGREGFQTNTTAGSALPPITIVPSEAPQNNEFRSLTEKLIANPGFLANGNPILSAGMMTVMTGLMPLFSNPTAGDTPMVAMRTFYDMNYKMAEKAQQAMGIENTKNALRITMDTYINIQQPKLLYLQAYLSTVVNSAIFSALALDRCADKTNFSMFKSRET